MSRTNIVAGNWKMNLTFEEGKALATEISEKLTAQDAQTIICPPYIHLQALSAITKNNPNLSIGAQNCHHEKAGAFTGEIAPDMLKSVGVEYAIIGHSERRAFNQEDDDLLYLKVKNALSEGLQVIFCCGEPLEIREKDEHFQYVVAQLENSLYSKLKSDDFKNIIIAYEPIWAIGTGKTASSEQAQEMHAVIRASLAARYDNDLAENVSILYGGSCKPGNAPELFAQKDVDGGLIGGASLNGDDFIAIIRSF